MELLAIGTVRTAWGVKGWLKLSSFSGEWEHFSSLDSVDLKKPGTNRSRQYRVDEFRMQQGGGMFKLAGIDSPEEAKLLAGSEILVPRENAAPLAADEWYLGELIGLELVGRKKEVYGRIISFVESADDLLEIERPDKSRFFVPFRSEFVGKPDLGKGKLVLKASWLADES